MSPKAIQYKASSIIFFKGDTSDRIFILNSGKVSLNYTDIETGQEIRDPIKTGEFFGVKSALGRYPREETALVLQDSTVIGFTVPEFEQLAAQNTRVIIKMLQVFSNQLRRIHKRVQNLLDTTEHVKPETGLYKIGEYYLKNKQYAQALYAYRKYLVYYPSGMHAADVTAKIEQTEQRLSGCGQAAGLQAAAGAAASLGVPPDAPAPASPGAVFSSAARPGEAAGPLETAGPAPGRELSDVAKAFYNAVSLVSQQKYQEAFKQFQKLAAEPEDEEYSAKARFEMGSCLYHMGQYDACIRTFTLLVQKYPKHPDLKEALFFVGKCYEDKGIKDRAVGFYKKILTMVSEEDPLYRKVRKALKTAGA